MKASKFTHTALSILIAAAPVHAQLNTPNFLGDGANTFSVPLWHSPLVATPSPATPAVQPAKSVHPIVLRTAPEKKRTPAKTLVRKPAKQAKPTANATTPASVPTTVTDKPVPATPPKQPTLLASDVPLRDELLSAEEPLINLATASNAPVKLKTTLNTFQREMDIPLGKALIVKLAKPAARVAISDPNVASATIISPTQIQLIGKKVGVANLLVWDNPNQPKHQIYDINVHRDVSVLAKQLQKIDPGINIVPMAADDSVILTGEVESPESAQLAVELAKAFFSGGGSNAQAPAGGAGSDTAGGSDLNSQAPGSAQTKPTANVINLIKVKGQPSTKLALVREKLVNIHPSIQLDIVPGPNGMEKAILTGKVPFAAMVSKAINTTSIFYGQPGLKVLTGPGGNLIRQTGNATFHDNQTFSDNVDINILQGSVVTDTSGNVVSMMQVSHKPQVRCKVKFLDISRRDLNQLGANLSGQTSGFMGGSFSANQSALRSISDFNPDSSGQSFSVNRNNSGRGFSDTTGLTQTFRNGLTQVVTIDRNLTAAISAFIEKRKIRSLAEPTLTMLSGEKASFLAGGEMPVPVTGVNGQISVSFKEFGIRLNLIPTVTEEGKIHLQVAPEVSQIDPLTTIVAGNISIPGFRTRRMQTTLELQDGQSFILAGLFNQESSETLSRFPGLGNLPVLGTFFRQKNADKLDNEMIVIIQPEVYMIPNETAWAPPAPGTP